MKKYLYLLFTVFVAVELSACSTDSNEPDGPQTEVPTPTPDPDPTPDPLSCITVSRTMCIRLSVTYRHR